MKKRTITISLKNWTRLAHYKLRHALPSYDTVLDRLFGEIERRWPTNGTNHQQ